MTTIVVARKNGIAAIAADTLTTFGETRLPAAYDRAHDKIVRVGESLLGISGSAAHHLVLQNLLGRQESVDLSGQTAIFETFRKLHPLLKDECYLNPKEEEDAPYESSQLCALIANPAGIFGIYSMREVFEYQRFWAIGSGRDYALGAMQALYDRLDSAEDIARAGALAGVEFDTGSALPLTVYCVTLAG